MKEVRLINKVVFPENAENDDETNEKLALERFDSEPGYYQQVIRPMLSPAHENELTFWLKDLGLIKNVQYCKNWKKNEKCSKVMRWEMAKIRDMYRWKCDGCSEKRSIRDDSMFTNIKCNFKNAVRILLGWCKGNDIESMTNMLGVRKSIVGALYKKAANVAEKFIQLNMSEWKIGGPGAIIIIDTYPEGCANPNQIRGGRPVLCISEIKSVPQRFWLETLNMYNRNNLEQIKSIKEYIVKAIQKIVLPGSILITPSSSVLCSYYDFEFLRNLYPIIVSTEDLSRHDNNQQNLCANLETIWKSVLDICEEAQYYNSSYIQQFIISHMWRRRYGNASFEVLMYQLGLMQ